MRDKRQWDPTDETLELVAYARKVIDDFHARGYQLTLRQVYYQLVSVNALPNTEASYRRLSQVLDRARWAGLIEMDALYDAGRQPEIPSTWATPAAALESLAQQYRTDPWAEDGKYGEPPRRVEVWAEKDAVKSVLAPLAKEYTVPYQSCRGFIGLSALVAGVKRGGYEGLDIIYVGDHDPSGLAMDDDIQDRFCMAGPEVWFERVALLPEQIDAYGLPPQPTKRTDSRATSYLLEHGGGSWELDALDPDVLRRIVESAIQERLPDYWEEQRVADERVRDQLRQVEIR